MILKLLGLLDIIAGLGLTLTAFGFDVRTWVLVGGIYLLAKALIFFMSLISIIDLLVGTILLTSLVFEWHVAILIVASLVLYQKGALSLFG